MSAVTESKFRNALIALAAVVLAVSFFLANHWRGQTVNLSQLAAQSVPLEVARSNQKPTVLEFYADWCASCRRMAPMLAQLESQYQDQINFVLLNVDNPKWLPELNQFRVNGIPHFVFLDPQGSLAGQSIGEQPDALMKSSLLALANGQTITAEVTGKTSPLEGQPIPVSQPAPMSHA